MYNILCVISITDFHLVSDGRRRRPTKYYIGSIIYYVCACVQCIQGVAIIRDT